MQRTLLLVMLATCAPLMAHAEAPRSYCARTSTDNTLRPIPGSLLPAANQAFGTPMFAKAATDTTVFRCFAGQVLICTVGANLSCGQANTSRAPGLGATTWCRENPDDSFIPAVVTGHDTIFAWQCHGGAPQIASQTLHADRQGFIAEYWKTLPPEH